MDWRSPCTKEQLQDAQRVVEEDHRAIYLALKRESFIVALRAIIKREGDMSTLSLSCVALIDPEYLILETRRINYVYTTWGAFVLGRRLRVTTAQALQTINAVEYPAFKTNAHPTYMPPPSGLVTANSSLIRSEYSSGIGSNHRREIFVDQNQRNEVEAVSLIHHDFHTTTY